LDTALLHEVIAGHDHMDQTSINAPVPAVVAAAQRGDVKGMKIGVIKELGGEGYQAGVSQRFAESLEILTSLGAEIVEVSCPSFEKALSAYYLIQPSECSSNLARFDGIRFGQRRGDDGLHSVEQVMGITRAAGFGPEVTRRIILGTYALSAGYFDAYYGQAQKVRQLIANDFAKAFGQVEVLVSPTAPTTAFKIGDKLDDPMAMYLNDVATIPVNMAGLPGMSLPVGLAPEDNLPVGLQIIAPALADDRLYNVGAALERALLDKWGAPILDSVAGIK
jgi:aspartyl-tRNA(Asn)/glutamyl-tRNA(Gln) amidotransferase subunit A